MSFLWRALLCLIDEEPLSRSSIEQRDGSPADFHPRTNKKVEPIQPIVLPSWQLKHHGAPFVRPQ
jgi:hypothetical protein